MSNRLINLAIPVLAAAILGGCSTIKFAYNNVDWLLLNKADHYLDLTDSQRRLAEQLVATRTKMHRRKELPDYVAALKEVRVMLATTSLPPSSRSSRSRYRLYTGAPCATPFPAS